MSINVFKSNNCFIASEELSDKEAFYTGIRTGSILSTIQGSSFDVTIDRQSPKQLGTKVYSVNEPMRQPDISLNFNYILNWPFINEGLVNLADLNSYDISSPSGSAQVAILSGYESASRNFYIFSRIGENKDALTGFIEGDSPNFTGYQCASVGNCYLTNYSLSYSVGSLPQVSAQFVGSNMQYVEVTGLKVPSPAINLQSGNANEVGELTFNGLREFNSAPLVMNPSNTGSVANLENLQIGGQALSGEHLLQSANLSLEIARSTSYGLGSDYPYERKMILPVRGVASFSSQVSGWDEGVISGVLGSDSTYGFDLTLESSGKSITYKIEDAKLESSSYSMPINNLMEFNASFSFEVSPNPKGLQISGNPQQNLTAHCNQQLDANIADAMDLAGNAPMLTGYTNPNGSATGGGYNAARSPYFWGKNIDFTSTIVWNNEGYPVGGGSEDFRKRGATAITKRHIIFAKHFALASSTKVYFCQPDGTWISRTILATDDHSTKDIEVGTLSEDLPDTITPAEIAPANINQYFKRNSLDAIDQYWRPIVVTFDSDKKGILLELTKASSPENIAYFDNPLVVPAPYSNLSEELVSGDSGNPVFLIINGKAILLSSLYTTGSSPSYSNYISDINALIAGADAAAGVSTGYKVTVANLGSLNLRRYPPL